MSSTLPGADVRGYYTAVGIELPAWAKQEGAGRLLRGSGPFMRTGIATRPVR